MGTVTTSRKTTWRAAGTGLFSLGLALALSATPAQAQTAPHQAERRAQLSDQSIAAGVLYVSSMLLGTWGLVGGIDVIGSSGASYCPTCDHSVERYVVLSAIASTAITGVLLIIAVALNIDHASRLRALDRETGRVTLAPGPGEVGLGVAFTLDE